MKHPGALDRTYICGGVSTFFSPFLSLSFFLTLFRSFVRSFVSSLPCSSFFKAGRQRWQRPAYGERVPEHRQPYGPLAQAGCVVEVLFRDQK